MTAQAATSFMRAKVTALNGYAMMCLRFLGEAAAAFVLLIVVAAVVVPLGHYIGSYWHSIAVAWQPVPAKAPQKR